MRRQLHPTPERYAEIQSALAEKGYYQGPTNGLWGQSSSDALAKFQQDNGLDPTGKIDSMSLIKLDLGPKYEPSTASTATPTPTAAPAAATSGASAPQ